MCTGLHRTIEIKIHPLLCSFVSYPLGKKNLHVKKYQNLKGPVGKRYKRLGNQNGNSNRPSDDSSTELRCETIKSVEIIISQKLFFTISLLSHKILKTPLGIIADGRQIVCTCNQCP